ncbi:MAG: PIN domain-containing protein [Candidatus Shapirobacteria bacterium]|jgi:predicted nucleic-acid-binding protein
MNPTDMTLPDTNIILRYLLNDEPVLSAKARSYWENVRDGTTRAKLTEGVLMECVYVLQRFYKVPRDAIGATLAALLAYKGLDSSNLDLFRASLEVYGQTKLDFIDCILYARVKAGEGRVISFDEKLNSLCKS